jgi:methyltransferase
MTAYLLAVAFVPMLLEAWVAARHERTLRAAGAFEPAADVYRMMRFAYPACFLAMGLEGWLRGVAIDTGFAIGAGIFALAKALKYWAIVTLGDRWTFRVLVPPGSPRIAEGPYGLMRHPNYVGVLGELVGMGFMAHAPIAAALSIVGFGALMLARIKVEEEALGNGG